MKQAYFYSPYRRLLFLFLGLIFSGAGYDSAYSHALINKKDESWWLTLIFLAFSFLLLSSFIKSIADGEKTVLEVEEPGIKLFTGSLNSEYKIIFVPREQIISVGEKRVVQIFKVGRLTPTVNALEIKTKSGTIKWPPVMVSRNRIYLEKSGTSDSIIIDAWLNKKNGQIAREINQLLKIEKN
jgi:hypothetical protein